MAEGNSFNRDHYPFILDQQMNFPANADEHGYLVIPGENVNSICDNFGIAYVPGAKGCALSTKASSIGFLISSSHAFDLGMRDILRQTLWSAGR